MHGSALLAGRSVGMAGDHGVSRTDMPSARALQTRADDDEWSEIETTRPPAVQAAKCRVVFTIYEPLRIACLRP